MYILCNHLARLFLLLMASLVIVASPYSVVEMADMAPFVMPEKTLVPSENLGFRFLDLLEDLRTRRMQYLITLRSFFRSSCSVLPNAASITLPKFVQYVILQVCLWTRHVRDFSRQFKRCIYVMACHVMRMDFSMK